MKINFNNIDLNNNKVYDDEFAEDIICTMINYFNSKKDYDTKFRKAQNLVLMSKNINGIHWYFQASFTHKWIDCWNIQDWKKYTPVICKYCSLEDKERIKDFLMSKFSKKTKQGDDVLLECLVKIRKSIKSQKDKIRKEKAKKLLQKQLEGKEKTTKGKPKNSGPTEMGE